jgi:hypothetical protein
VKTNSVLNSHKFELPNIPNFDCVVNGGSNDQPRLSGTELDVGHLAFVQARIPDFLS